MRLFSWREDCLDVRERSPTGDQAGLKWPLSNMEKAKSSKVFFQNQVNIEDGEILEENGK